jgi:hypothetical protein
LTTQPVVHDCVICHRRPYERAQVCDPCRRWLAADLGQLAGLAALLPAASVPDRSVEGGIPLRIAAVDLALPAVGGASARTVHDPYRDQIGEAPIAGVLDSWAQDWTITRGLSEHLPAPTVPVLCGWLLARLPDECDQHPAIDEFARSVRQMLAAVRRVLCMESPRAVHYGAPCPRCGTETLSRRVGADWIECDGCGRLWNEEGYAELVTDIVPAETLLTAAEVATMTGRTRDAVYKLVKRGRLLPDVGPWGGVMRFRKGDVVAA